MVGVGAGVCVPGREEGGEHDPGKTPECRRRSREGTRRQEQTWGRGALETGVGSVESWGGKGTGIRPGKQEAPIDNREYWDTFTMGD